MRTDNFTEVRKNLVDKIRRGSNVQARHVRIPVADAELLLLHLRHAEDQSRRADNQLCVIKSSILEWNNKSFWQKLCAVLRNNAYVHLYKAYTPEVKE